ncbi:MAG TPA: NUDIX domain-containing protein [Rhodanobacteraceae bacterium]|nr:NUDIX domain-containing protein [Rhodanobacteraceae bacterium]
MIGTQCNMVSVLALRGEGEAARVLIVRRAGHYLDGVWSYTAGHIEAGEPAWQTARRELAEETALVPLALYATSFCETFYDASAGCIQVVPAFVARIAIDAQVRLNHEASAWRWVSFAEAAQVLPFGSQRDLLAHVEREFIQRQPMDVLRMPVGSWPPRLAR